MTETGVIHGRFQVLHNDHLAYLLAGKARCRFLVVGITNPDPSMTRDDPADPARSTALANPLTWYERMLMARAALAGAGVPFSDFAIAPFPVNVPELLRHYVPLDAVFYLTIYDEWGRAKRAAFERLGLKTEVLWTRAPGEKGISGSNVRRRMAEGLPWEHLVPPPVSALARAWGVPARLRALAAEEKEQTP